MVVKIRDLIAAEEALEAAEGEFRKFNDDPSQWMAFESLDKRGRKHLNIHPGHFEHREALMKNVEARHIELRSLRVQFNAEAGVQVGAQAEGF